MNVVDKLMDLHVALELNYMRTGLKIHLEPDAFYRLASEVLGKTPMAPISEELYNKNELVCYTPAGPITIVKDESLGSNGYVRRNY
jgi:hypothetical protein